MRVDKQVEQVSGETVEPRRIWGNMKDITGVEIVEVQIRADGKVLWVNTEEGCVLRICQIKGLHLTDSRKSFTKRHQDDLFYSPKLPKIPVEHLPEVK